MGRERGRSGGEGEREEWWGGREGGVVGRERGRSGGEGEREEWWGEGGRNGGGGIVGTEVLVLFADI